MEGERYHRVENEAKSPALDNKAFLPPFIQVD